MFCPFLWNDVRRRKVSHVPGTEDKAAAQLCHAVHHTAGQANQALCHLDLNMKWLRKVNLTPADGGHATSTVHVFCEVWDALSGRTRDDNARSRQPCN